ncbi:DUF554 domain-containing protein [Enterococcus cecorum]|uniref:DUF554 domain-containing protein n=1 Tax=Enterococcus cecorum TaxID=44008 RepID=A0A1Y4R1A8_9ENTE|nr:DUF554 domain-containing protein [Enterococcus cecorum]OUQ11358.1 hypothetical protein B5E88_02560 [Enterococcus cecorum]CAI3262330.1 hypothetical protein CIRMBP1283_00134 [Enterococcus cecorum]CAI3391765.1 hypothetical protein CIRMBP1280_01546 [Enterococcus cecorum]CAI3400041.1 hypothetical protein CIRMBP1279_01492 [Enterococcus cecorum]CAI3406944.1 hypothetical protein CIRMBP1285_01556 [Enterococcus cecorum]
MPTGVIINALSVVLGGMFGGFFGEKLSDEFKKEITLIFGVCSMGMGISTIVLMKNMPAVVFAVIIGTAVGLILHVGQMVKSGATYMQIPINKIFGNHSHMDMEDFQAQLVTIIVLFCASGTGIYGSLDAGMTGDHTILIAKSILDFFTAAIFACNLGYVVSVIALPQFVIFFLLFLGAKLIFPLTDPTMIADFKAVGGFLMLATGFRMVNIKQFPTADMIPAMVFAMPFSYLWTAIIMPML